MQGVWQNPALAHNVIHQHHALPILKTLQAATLRSYQAPRARALLLSGPMEHCPRRQAHPAHSPVRGKRPRQYKNRRSLFGHPGVLSEFELKTLKAMQSAEKNSCEFSTWFAAFQHMCEETGAIDAHIAIRGSGAYRFPLAASVRSWVKKRSNFGEPFKYCSASAANVGKTTSSCQSCSASTGAGHAPRKCRRTTR